MEALVFIVFGLGYMLFWMIGGMIAFIFSPIGLIVLFLMCCDCGCNRR